MRRKVLISTLMAATLPTALLAGCSSGSSGAPTGYAIAQKAADITVSASALQQATIGSEAFSLALMRALGDGAAGSNVVFSPQTLVDLLAMILPGASGQSAMQVSDALGDAGLDPSTIAGALGKLDATARADANQGPNTLQESGDVWTDSSLKIAPSYLATLDGAFGVGVHQTDFANDPTGSAQAIDNLVAQETHGYIPQLFDPKSFSKDAALVLTDAVYLNATWASQFSPNLTTKSSFHPASGSATQASMMNNTDDYKYASGDGWQLVELPYAGGKTAMDILLPTKGIGTLSTLRDSLSATKLNAMLSSMTTKRVALSIPKFTTNYSAGGLIQTLTKLDLGSLFTDSELTAMTAPSQPLSIGQVVEKAYVAVGEKGTVAAAAAGAVAVGTAAMQVDATVTADHPFLYLVRDVPTGQLLFAGQVATA
jgi:serpin B